MNKFMKHVDPEDVLVTNLYRMQREFGWSLEEVKHLPLSTYTILVEEMNKDAKEMERSMKK